MASYVTHCSHQHMLVRTPGPSQLFICDVCRCQGSGLHYRCDACDFDLHEHCAKLPETVSFFAHPRHNLRLASGECRDCDICSQPAQGFFYRCIGCNFDVHPHCATTQQVVRTALHPAHCLSLVAGAFACNACHQGHGAWFYRCEMCNVSLHINCLHGPILPMPAMPAMPMVNPHFAQTNCPQAQTAHCHAGNNDNNSSNGSKRARVRRFMHKVGTEVAVQAVASTVTGLIFQ